LNQTFPAFFAGRKFSKQSDRKFELSTIKRHKYHGSSRFFGEDPAENAEPQQANKAITSRLYLRLLQTEEGRTLLCFHASFCPGLVVM
jgi:hypothetical protein